MIAEELAEYIRKNKFEITRFIEIFYMLIQIKKIYLFIIQISLNLKLKLIYSRYFIKIL